MKKIAYLLLLPFLAIGLGGVLQSCGESDDFSKPHYLTDDELRELQRQDSLRLEALKKINADLVIDYKVEAYPSSQWDSKTLEIDFAPVAELFGLTVDEVLSGLHQAPDAPAIEGFAIQGTTHADYMVASNSNGIWGHWWRFDGDVAGTYNEDASRFFCEWQGYYDEEDNANHDCYFNVGQLPGVCVAGDSFTVIECLRYQAKRVAFRITYNVIERGEVVAGVVNTQKLTLNMPPNSTYKTFDVPFDLDRALSDLGVGSLIGLDWVGVNADGSYAQEYTADNPGFWFDKDGYVGTWGDTASVFATYAYADEDPAVIKVGQFPEALEVGQSVTVSMGVTNGTQIEMFEITCNIEAFQDPETPPTGTPYDVTKDIALTKPYSDDYAAVYVEDMNVQEILRDAFKMTTYQIFNALNNGELKVYIGEVSAEDPEYTGSGPGEYWVDGDGAAIDYGNGIIYTGLECSETEIYFYGGVHPDNCSPTGQTVAYKYIITCNGATVTFNVNFVVTAKE